MQTEETPIVENLPAGSPELIALWSHALKEWDEEGRHAALLEMATERRVLGDLARLYRSVENDGTRKERVEQAMKQITTRALLTLDTSKAQPKKKNKALLLAIGVVWLLGIAWLLAKAFGR